jgi:hypothetical protein
LAVSGITGLIRFGDFFGATPESMSGISETWFSLPQPTPLPDQLISRPSLNSRDGSRLS